MIKKIQNETTTTTSTLMMMMILLMKKEASTRMSVRERVKSVVNGTGARKSTLLTLTTCRYTHKVFVNEMNNNFSDRCVHGSNECVCVCVCI